MERTTELENGFSITVRGDEDAEFADYLHQQIKAFNDRISEHHRTARAAGQDPLHVWVHDRKGELLGGLAATTYWQWLDIDNFWLAEAARDQGIGRTVLQLAEDEAIARGCIRASLRTFDFQARGFYEKQGYRVVGVLEDYPPGGALYWMRKDFPR